MDSLPNSLRKSAFDNFLDDCLKHSLKTFIFSGFWRTERSGGIHDCALYNSAFTYLNLLTYTGACAVFAPKMSANFS